MDSTKIAIATVTNKKFLVGTLVVIYSFLKHNKRFSGDIVVISDDLLDEDKKLFRCFNNVKFNAVSSALTKAVNGLCEIDPRFINKKARFYSLEAFALNAYNKVLFLDSDILITDSLEDCFGLGSGLYCCPDRTYYLGLSRNEETFQFEKASGSSQKFFNAGFMLIDNTICNETVYNNLLELVNSKTWEKNETTHTDQLILNKYFNDKAKFLSSKYCLNHQLIDECLARDNYTLDEVKSIHFVGKYKPWDLLGSIGVLLEDIRRNHFYELWFKSYLDFIKEHHLKDILNTVSK